MFNYYTIMTFIGGLFFSSFGLLSYIKNKKGLSNKIFGLLSLSFAFWDYSWFIMLLSINNESRALLFAKLLNFGAIWIPILYLHWVLSVLEIDRKRKKVLKAGYVSAALFSLFSFSNQFISGVHPVLSFPFWPTPGILYKWFILFGYCLFFGYGIYNLIIYLRKKYGHKKYQIIYILIGSLFGVIGGATNFAFMYNIEPLISPFFLNFGVTLLTLTSLVFAYAAIKYRLMNVRLVLTRSIVYAILIVFVAGFFSLSVLIVGSTIGSNTHTSTTITYIIASFIIVLFLDPIKEFIARITDKIFYKDKIDYQKLLQEAGNIIAKEIDLKLLSEKLSSLLSNRLKIKRSYIYDSSFKALASYGHRAIEIDENLSGFLSVQTEIIIIEELIRDINNNKYSYNSEELNKIVDSLQDLGIEMIVPIMDVEKHIAYLLLSEKQSGDFYNEEDIEFFKVLIPQIASAFEKSQLYNEVQKFNVKLQKKVEEKTSSLKEANEALEARNKFLTTMQVVANMLSRTLDLKQVTQMIADSISTELSYVGGIVSFVDDNRQSLQVKAITNTEETRIILNTLPEDLKSYKAELKMGYNLAVDTVLSGEMKYSKNLSDFVCPPANEEIIAVAQEALQIKTIVGVPIYSEDKVIGLINFLLPFPEEDISFLDREIMTAMTNQVGILYRNLELYDNLQGTNKELQEANVHLRALDKAKSEFVSIASHQLRTPISAIKGYLSMLMEGDFGELSSSVKNVIEGLFDSSSRLARLVNTFLNVSRIESGRLKLDIKPINVDTLVTSVVDELSNEAAQKGLKLTYEPEKDLPKAMADSDKLREVILNLIDNSIKYTPKGSVKVSLFADDEKLTFQVKDTGIGIDPVEAKGLFRKFVRGSGVAQIHTGGSGLGLFIAQRIINEHQGKIWAESKGREKGSTFKFEVPIEKN